MSWLKFDTATPEKPEVFAITIALGWEDPDLTVGKLLKVWRWFDIHSVDGNAKSVTLALLDRLIGVTGLSQAMVDVGWLEISSDGLMLPNFENHNGKTAKDRALTAKRAATHRGNDKSNAPSVINALPREEKKREEKIEETETVNKTPAQAPAGFDNFWNEYPNTHRKQSKGKCLEVWKKAKAEPDAMVIVNHVARLKASPDWTKNNGEFIPAPLVYLNNRRWEGAGDTQHEGGIMAGAI